MTYTYGRIETGTIHGIWLIFRGHREDFSLLVIYYHTRSSFNLSMGLFLD
jgi:hypothetical protein